MAIKQIGILGSGFGGLYTVFYLKKHLKKSLGQEIYITLFDKNNYLLYTPVLHEVATGTACPRHVVIPIRKIINPRKIHIQCEEVLRVDLKERSMETPSGIFKFDCLVLSHGSESNFYSIPGAQENSLTFKTIEDAIRLRNHLVRVLEKEALERDREKKRKFPPLIVAGGGCTGVEVATEVAEFINVILDKDYPEIKRSDVRITLIEALDRILPSFPQFLSHVASERLKQMGIEILLNSPIQLVDQDSISLKDGRQIPKGILVWTGGVKARNLFLRPEVERDQNNRISVNEYLEIPGYPGVYAIGDGAHFGINGSPLPPTASVAVQQARYVAQNILCHIQNGEVLPFQFHYRGDMASLGFMHGVIEIYGWQFRGSIAWILWKAFKLEMLPRYKNRLQIVADWLITLIFNRDTSMLM